MDSSTMRGSHICGELITHLLAKEEVESVNFVRYTEEGTMSFVVTAGVVWMDVELDTTTQIVTAEFYRGEDDDLVETVKGAFDQQTTSLIYDTFVIHVDKPRT